MLIGTCHRGTILWAFDGLPELVTACKCTLRRRYGVLWAYDYEGEKIKLRGPTAVYTRVDVKKPALEIHFCPKCGCVADWRGTPAEADGRRRVAVNVCLIEPGAIAHLAIDHFDGLDSFDDLPRDARCVRDLWF